MNQQTIGFIGGGNMATSLIHGLVKSGFDPKSIWVCDHNPEKRQRLSGQFGIHNSDSNKKVAEVSDVLVLAVKPQQMQEVIKIIRGSLKSHHTLIISIAAGINTQHLSDWFQERLPFVRAMPNTPALLNVGATGLYATNQVSEDHKNLAESIMRAIGVIVWVNHEKDIDIISALSGSGPAYFFLIMEALQQAGEKMGLSEETAKMLTLQTALGAARMAMESEIELDELRSKVASKGGTTEKALDVLESGGLRTLLYQALEAAKNRSQEISKHLSENKA